MKSRAFVFSFYNPAPNVPLLEENKENIAKLFKVRPVINLKNNIIYDSGNGKIDTPYKIK